MLLSLWLLSLWLHRRLLQTAGSVLPPRLPCLPVQYDEYGEGSVEGLAAAAREHRDRLQCCVRSSSSSSSSRHRVPRCELPAVTARRSPNAAVLARMRLPAFHILCNPLQQLPPDHSAKKQILSSRSREEEQSVVKTETC